MVNNYNQRLEFVNTIYGQRIEPSKDDSKHHMAVNSELYKFNGIGVIPLFLRNFVDDLPDYVDGERIHIVKEKEVNRLDFQNIIEHEYFGYNGS